MAMDTLEATYQGDITPDGIQPFRVDPRDKVSPRAVELLERASHVVVTEGSDAQGMIIRSETKLKKPGDFERFPDLAYVARAGVGVDNIDMPLAAQNGVATVNTPGASTDAVALRSMTLMQAWAARLYQATNALRGQEWPRGRKDLEPIDLTERTLGVVGGQGRIGRRIRERAADIFGKVLWNDIRTDEEGGVDLDTLLRESHVVTIAASGKQEILTAERLKMLREGALVVNTARGTNVDTKALLEAMDARGIHAALDVYPDEGADMFTKNPHLRDLVAHPNFIGTAHSAVSDPVTQRKLGEEAAQRVVEFAQDGTINPAGLPGHTLPRISLANNHVPGVRAVLVHPSVPGTIERITHPIAQRGVNINGFANGEGPTKLAATLVHMEGVDPDQALAIMREIERNVDILKRRLLAFA
jgi:D-3-phosphoglycerate dehydrogenase